MDRGTWWATQSMGLQETDTSLWLNHHHHPPCKVTDNAKERNTVKQPSRNQVKKGKMWDSVLLILVTSASHHTEKKRKAERDGSR